MNNTTIETKEVEWPEVLTADGLPFNPSASYHFFDHWTGQVYQALGMRRIYLGAVEFASPRGRLIAPMPLLRTDRDEALADGQAFFKSKIDEFQEQIDKCQLLKLTASQNPTPEGKGHL